jgi:hypothetical protein
MLYPAKRLLATILFFFLLTISHQALAIDAEQAGAALYRLLSSNYLLESYKKSECNRYIDKISGLIENNNKKITEIVKQLGSNDQKEFKKISDSQDTVRGFELHAKANIYDTISRYKNTPGGIVFACGVAYGKVENDYIRAFASFHSL